MGLQFEQFRNKLGATYHNLKSFLQDADKAARNVLDGLNGGMKYIVNKVDALGKVPFLHSAANAIKGSPIFQAGDDILSIVGDTLSVLEAGASAIDTALSAEIG